MQEVNRGYSAKKEKQPQDGMMLILSTPLIKKYFFKIKASHMTNLLIMRYPFWMVSVFHVA